MANFINISQSAQNFTAPMPFQHFTGDYTNATLIRSIANINVNRCDAECKNESTCEFYTFTNNNNTCNLYAANSTLNTITGVKINSSLRNVGMSNIYSSSIPSTTSLSAPTTRINAEACETSCNTNALCGVYTYNRSSQLCTLYGATSAAGNLGSSRDIVASGGSVVSSSRILFENFTVSLRTLTNLLSMKFVYSIDPSILVYVSKSDGTIVVNDKTIDFFNNNNSIQTIVPVNIGDTLNIVDNTDPSIVYGTAVVTSSPELIIDSAVQELNNYRVKGRQVGFATSDPLYIIPSNLDQNYKSDYILNDFITSGVLYTYNTNSSSIIAYNDVSGYIASPPFTVPTFVTPTINIDLVNSSFTPTSLTLKGTVTLTGSSTTLTVFVNGTSVGTITQTNFTSANGATVSVSVSAGSGTIEVKATDDNTVTSGSQSINIINPTPTIAVTPVSLSRTGITVDLTTSGIPPGSTFVINISDIDTFDLVLQSGTRYSYNNTKRLWDGAQNFTVSVKNNPSIVSSLVYVTIPISYASGGVIDYSFVSPSNMKRYITHTFTATGSNQTFTLPSTTLTYDVIIVAGGGGGGGPSGGGARGCGGGGGGGVLELRNISSTGSSSIIVNVGNGGAGGVSGNGNNGNGLNGSNTIFGIYNVPGGGGGAGDRLFASTGNNIAASGGGGAAGATASASSSSAGGITTSNRTVGSVFGNNGASGFTTGTAGDTYFGGGGGGAASAGINGNSPNGGNGYVPSIEYTYSLNAFGAGGGGGANKKSPSGLISTASAGRGGNGGGGNGGYIEGNDSPAFLGVGGNNATGYGCGGGGGAATGGTPSSRPAGGRGSNGIVIVRYLYEDL